MKTTMLYCNGSWKYTVISRVDSSEKWVFHWDLGSTRIPTTANALTTSAIGTVWYRCITKRSLSKFDRRFNYTNAGPLVFEIWSPAVGSLGNFIF